VVSELANTTFEIPSFTAASITLYVLSAFTRNVSLSGRIRMAGTAAK
jgi:hypothetical protein